jgi:hypothetical protein
MACFIDFTRNVAESSQAEEQAICKQSATGPKTEISKSLLRLLKAGSPESDGAPREVAQLATALLGSRTVCKLSVSFYRLESCRSPAIVHMATTAGLEQATAVSGYQ